MCVRVSVCACACAFEFEVEVEVEVGFVFEARTCSRRAGRDVLGQ